MTTAEGGHHLKQGEACLMREPGIGKDHYAQTRRDAPSAPGEQQQKSLSAPSHPPITLRSIMFALAISDTGWLRLVPADEGKTVYLKWKWTVGELKNRYVMTRGRPEEVENLFLLLLEKKQAAESGQGRTSEDKWYTSE